MECTSAGWFRVFQRERLILTLSKHTGVSRHGIGHLLMVSYHIGCVCVGFAK